MKSIVLVASDEYSLPITPSKKIMYSLFDGNSIISKLNSTTGTDIAGEPIKSSYKIELSIDDNGYVIKKLNITQSKF